MAQKIWQRAEESLAAPGVPHSFQHVDENKSIADILRSRELGRASTGRRRHVRDNGSKVASECHLEHYWAENQSATKHESRYFELPQSTKSTISIAISPDGKLFASTHGDHTVKIICFATGKVIQTLVGHPRTPWSVKFHPTNPRYVASGCLGFEVRFWDVYTGRCLYVHKLRHAIISISFHPSGDVLAIASGTCVYTWDYQHAAPRPAMISSQTLRSVTFLPDPTKVLVGESNERPNRVQGQETPADLTVTISRWDFDLQWALNKEPPAEAKGLSNTQTVLSHALIYNDGGIDVSRCGRYLAVCSDFSLRQAEVEAEEAERAEAQNDVTEIMQSSLSSEPVGVEAAPTSTGGTDAGRDEVDEATLQFATNLNDSTRGRNVFATEAFDDGLNRAYPNGGGSTWPSYQGRTNTNTTSAFLQRLTQSRQAYRRPTHGVLDPHWASFPSLQTRQQNDLRDETFRNPWSPTPWPQRHDNDPHMNQALRRVRPRLQQNQSISRRWMGMEPRSAPIAPPSRFTRLHTSSPLHRLETYYQTQLPSFRHRSQMPHFFDMSNMSYNPQQTNSMAMRAYVHVPGRTGVQAPRRVSRQMLYYNLTDGRHSLAISNTQLTDAQRERRTRLAQEVQSTWLTLVSLEEGQLGKVVQTRRLEGTAAGGVTSVKVSPCSGYVLLGYGVRDRRQRENEFRVHRVTRIYRWDDLSLQSHVESEMDDVNIALFSPVAGAGFLYGTKQGKIRVCTMYRGGYVDEENCNVKDAARRRHFDGGEVVDEDMMEVEEEPLAAEE